VLVDSDGDVRALGRSVVAAKKASANRSGHFARGQLPHLCMRSGPSGAGFLDRDGSIDGILRRWPAGADLQNEALRFWETVEAVALLLQFLTSFI
jgi:hypothetical protein